MDSPVNIDLSVLDNQITNIKEIIDLLNTRELTPNFIDHLKNLKNRLDSMDLENKEELLKVFDCKIIEFETKNSNSKTNQEALNLLRDVISDLPDS